MATNEYGIRYFKAQLDDTTYILIPINLVEGYSVSGCFYSDRVYPYPITDVDYKENRTVVDSIVTEEQLKAMYNMEDVEFLKQYYLTEEKDKVIIVELLKDGKIRKRKYNISTVKSDNPRETYELHNEQPAILLNEDALSILLSLDTPQEVRAELLRLQKNMHSIEKVYKKDGVTSVTLEQGKIVKVDTEHPVKPLIEGNPDIKMIPSTLPIRTSEISVEGLEQYIKERIFGHDDEISDIATILTMNYYSTKEFGTESILIPGPTGTGKTATFKVASEYLNLPFAFVNTINLVPQGIKGTSLEDVLYSLIVMCNGDLNKAQKAMVVFDEFDKIGNVGTDIKEDLKQIMLKFIEGGEFQINRQQKDYTFDTFMLSKVFLGAFSDVFTASKKSIGFASTEVAKTTGTFDIQKLYESTAFSRELITRIPHIIPYYELSNDIKRKVILESKISEYLLKKKRYQAQFGVELVDSNEYIDALIEHLQTHEQSMRDLNNLISSSLLKAENAMLRYNGRVKKLVLNGDTVTNPSSFDLS